MPKSTYVIAIISITSRRNVSDVTVSDSDIHQLQFGSWVSYGRWSFEVAYANTTACHCGFYRAMLSLLCIRGTSHGPVSVCLSVCVCLTQAGVLLKRQNIGSHKQHHTIPPGTLVFGCQRSPLNSTGVTSYEGAECRWGGSKSATFDK